jgi:aminoglycoside phosphotransferase (APT) family kinase protein
LSRRSDDAVGADEKGWARARRVLEHLARQKAPLGATVEIGRAVKIGDGLSRDVFVADLDVDPDPDKISDDYAVLLPGKQVDAGLEERTLRELEILPWLETLAKTGALPFRVPRLLGASREEAGTVMVRTCLPGLPLDLRAERQAPILPWEVVGQVAAAIHVLDPASAPQALGGHVTRREHALSTLAVLEEIEAETGHARPIARDARAWALEHLPPDEPSSLLHGDLLGQNIIFDRGSKSLGIGVIDWEYATRGDPAYDLAIVTRGVRRPFQLADGLDRLLEAYARAGKNVTSAHVRVHELALAGGWYRDSADRFPREERLAQLRRVLEMASRG